MTRWIKRAPDALRWLVWGSRVLYRGAANLIALFRGGDLATMLEPWRRYSSALDIPFEELSSLGIRAVFFDLENTLVPPGGPFSDEGRTIVGKARAAGLAVGVVSNASAAWVRRALDEEGIACVAPAGKPGPGGFIEACGGAGVQREEAVYVGDQIITDIVGAQRAGLRAILVEPTHAKEFLSARFQRLVARILLRVAGKSGAKSERM